MMNSAAGPYRAIERKTVDKQTADKKEIGNIRQFPLEADIEAWIEQYGNGLLRLCFLQLGDYALAEDAVQETFIRAWQNYERFEHRSSVKTWITTIAVNVCRSMRRSPWHRRVT